MHNKVNIAEWVLVIRSYVSCRTGTLSEIRPNKTYQPFVAVLNREYK
jgi:hypothetical protein